MCVRCGVALFLVVSVLARLRGKQLVFVAPYRLWCGITVCCSPCRQVAGVIVENTFLSIAHMVDHLFPILAPFKFLLRLHYKTHDRVQSLPHPVLLVSVRLT